MKPSALGTIIVVYWCNDCEKCNNPFPEEICRPMEDNRKWRVGVVLRSGEVQDCGRHETRRQAMLHRRRLMKTHEYIAREKESNRARRLAKKSL
jgi:hypothetical protein